MIEKILIAGDSVTARMIIRQCLVVAGCTDSNFIEARDGIEALQMAEDTRIDLLVTEINMPNMNGRTLLEKVKTHPEMTQLPVLVISSVINDAYARELLEKGAFGVVQKPVSPASVLPFVKVLNGQSQWGWNG